MEKLEALCPACGKAHGTADMETSVEVLQKLKVALPYDPASILDACAEE